jgi:hypothetical protein
MKQKNKLSAPTESNPLKIILLTVYHIHLDFKPRRWKKLSNYSDIRDLIRRFSGQENVFTVPKVYVQYTGDLTTAVLLNQIVFYSDKSKRTDGFFYKTYKEWEDDVCLTERQVRHSVNKLKDKGVLETKLMKANGSPTVHYKLKYDELVESILTKCKNPILQNVSIQSDNKSESLTENTTETTTKKDIYIQYAEFVKMKETEYNTLVELHGRPLVAKMIQILDNYKGANGKKYKSDYRAILNWVVDKVKGVKNERTKQGSRKPDTSEYDGLSL